MNRTNTGVLVLSLLMMTLLLPFGGCPSSAGPPSPAFTFGISNLTVTFTDTSAPGGSPITAWSWNFGDGTFGSTRNPSHTYSSPGTYSVTLAVTNASGTYSVQHTVTLAASGTGPVAAFTFVPTGLAVAFTDTSAAGSTAITARAWAFGDGGTSTLKNPSHTYAAAGSYTVSLKVTDAASKTSTATQTVSVTASAANVVSAVVIDHSAELAQLRTWIEDHGYCYSVGPNTALDASDDALCGTHDPDYKSFNPAKDGKGLAWSDPDEKALPSSLDLRSQLTSVKNQNPCGSCWAMATIGVTEGLIKQIDGVSVDLAEQWLVSCNTSSWSCGGGNIAFDYLISRPDSCGKIGAAFERDFPYRASDTITPTCNYPRQYKLDSWSFVNPSNHAYPTVTQIKNALVAHGPLWCALYANNAFKAYKGGIFDSNTSGEINHAVILAGWDDTLGKNGAWIVKNSWGTDWGLNGYAYVGYGCNSIGYAACYAVYAGAQQANISVPNLVGSTEAQALTALQQKGLTAGSVSYRVQQGVAAGTVFQQTPSPGTLVAAGSPINFVVCNSTFAPPEVVSPENNAYASGTQITLTWKAVSGATKYQTQVSTDKSFVENAFTGKEETTTSTKWTGFKNDKVKYYWRVRGGNAAGWGEWSFPSAFVNGTSQSGELAEMRATSTHGSMKLLIGGGNTIVVSGDGEDTIISTPGEVTATASPDAGYKFSHWAGDVSGESPTVTFNWHGLMTVEPVYILEGAS